MDYGKYFPFIEQLLKDMNIDTYQYHILDHGHWMKFNKLRDEGNTITEISKKTEIHEIPALFALERVRVCVIKYNGNVQKVRACVDGKD